jgi:hypothetical protein
MAAYIGKIEAFDETIEPWSSYVERLGQYFKANKVDDSLKHCKMDSLSTAINLMNKNCYFASINLKDTFFSIPAKESDRKYLRVTWNGTLYQFTYLKFLE